MFLLNQCKYKIMKEVGRTGEVAKVKAKSWMRHHQQYCKVHEDEHNKSVCSAGPQMSQMRIKFLNHYDRKQLRSSLFLFE